MRNLLCLVIVAAALVACDDGGSKSEPALDSTIADSAADGAIGDLSGPETDAVATDTAPDSAPDSVVDGADLTADGVSDGGADIISTDGTSDLGQDVSADAADSNATDLAADLGTDGDGSSAQCAAGALGEELGLTQLAIGGAMSDMAFAAAPFDIRYQYLAGAVPAGGPCASCATGCTVEGASCANTAGCAWWGCWQYDQDPPGQFVADFIAGAEAGGAIPMISYYIWFAVSGYVEGAPEIAALADADRVADYVADWRFLMERINGATSGPVIVHIEPDLWGFAQQINASPSAIGVALTGADAACTGLSNDLLGFASCLVAIARAEAPAVKLGFHASAWAVGNDALINTDAQYDIIADAQSTASFLAAIGADSGDLIIVEMTDRDAGFNNRWWDETDQALPHFSQAISWTEALGQALDLPVLWWQVPYGHPGLDDTCDRYTDNRVDYVFDHPDRFANGQTLGVAFGAGAGCMTTPDSDDGHFVTRAQSYFASTPPGLCP